MGWREDTQDRLHNWCRVYRNYPHWQACRSLEGRYIPERVADELPQAKRAVADHKDAALLESILTSKTFPDVGRRVIVYAYITPKGNLDGWLRKLRKLYGYRLHGNFDEHQRKYEDMVYNRLIMLDRATYIL
jgi:hypothetical protein